MIFSIAKHHSFFCGNNITFRLTVTLPYKAVLALLLYLYNVLEKKNDMTHQSIRILFRLSNDDVFVFQDTLYSLSVVIKLDIIFGWLIDSQLKFNYYSLEFPKGYVPPEIFSYVNSAGTVFSINKIISLSLLFSSSYQIPDEPSCLSKKLFFFSLILWLLLKISLKSLSDEYQWDFKAVYCAINGKRIKNRIGLIKGRSLRSIYGD